MACAAEIVVVIPAHREAHTLGPTLQSLELDARSAAVVVVNQEAHQDTRAENEATAAVAEPFEHVTVVDRFRPSTAFPEGSGGVGAARRAGMDYAARSVRSGDALIVSLDADSPVDPGFMDALRAWKRGGAPCGLTSFEHPLPTEAGHRLAIVAYETWLRYFALALRRADSPYAHVSLGCTIVCTADCYAAVAGMPTRAAGEDFYFLQKLVKAHGLLPRIPGAMVRPSARASARVPFGTGPAIREILRGTASYDGVEPAAAFGALRTLFGLVTKLQESDVALEGVDPELRTFLDELDVTTILARLRRNHGEPIRFTRAFHQWFDALRTTQFVRRFARAHGLQDVADAVEAVSGIPAHVSAEARLMALRGDSTN